MKSPKKQLGFYTGILPIVLICCFVLPATAQEDSNTDADGSEDVDAQVRDKASIVLLERGNTLPALNDVTRILIPDLEKVGVQIQIDAVVESPNTQEEWATYVVEKNKEIPGLLGVFGWNCEGGGECQLYAMESRSLALTVLPVGDSRIRVFQSENPTDAQSVTANHVAAGIREMVYGDFLFTLPRVSRHVNDPATEREQPAHQYQYSTEDDGDDTPVVVVETYKPPVVDRTTHRVWLEFGYIGNYPYPASGTQHGVSLGMTIFLHKHFAPSLRVAGLARRKADGRLGTIEAYQVPVSIQLQIPFYVGPAVFAIAPMAQYDYTWARADTKEGELLNSYWSDFSFGGETTWRVPMPRKNLDIYFGAGILATLFSEDYYIREEKVMPMTKLQFYWLAGLSKNIFAD